MSVSEFLQRQKDSSSIITQTKNNIKKLFLLCREYTVNCRRAAPRFQKSAGLPLNPNETVFRSIESTRKMKLPLVREIWKSISTNVTLNEIVPNLGTQLNWKLSIPLKALLQVMFSFKERSYSRFRQLSRSFFEESIMSMQKWSI